MDPAYRVRAARIHESGCYSQSPEPITDHEGSCMIEVRRSVPSLFLAGLIASSGLAETVLPGPFHDQTQLVPDTSVDGPVLELDFEEIHIGIAEYREGPSGATVFYFPEPVLAAVDVRGGAPGVINSEALHLRYDEAYTNAICLAGGSSYGLAAATGVADAIKEHTENPGHWENIAFVPGAIIFDLGGRRFNAVTPDYELGKAALRAARPGRFPLGPQGAGRFAMQGWFLGDPQHSGQGAAFRQVGQTKVAVFTVVNPGGSVIDRDGRVVRCSGSVDGDCSTITDRIEARLAQELPSTESRQRSGLSENTTISLVVTNEKMAIEALQRLAVQVNTSMARAIQPYSLSSDGDTLFAVTTGKVQTEGLSMDDLGVLVSEVAWDAVLASVPVLPDSEPIRPISWDVSQLEAAVGSYRLSRWASLRLIRDGDTLLAQGPDVPNLYFPADRPIALTPVSATDLVTVGDRGYRIRLVFENHAVTGLVLEPGPWAIRAERID